MEEGRVDKLDDAIQQMSFSDLPDVIMFQIFERLDLASQLKLRLNRRLNELQLQVKNVLGRCILKIDTNHYELKEEGAPPIRSHNFDALFNGFERLALNTTIHDFTIYMNEDVPDEQINRVLEFLPNFGVRLLWVVNAGMDSIYLPQLAISSILALTRNLEYLNINAITPLTSQELYTLRKTILEGDCKAEHFYIRIDQDMQKSLVQACFGVTIEDDEEAKTRTYRTTDETLELYTNETLFDMELHYFEGGFETAISDENFYVKKCTDNTKPDQNGGEYRKILLNRPYTIIEWDEEM